MNKPDWAEEYDGYEIPEPRKMSKEEWQEMMKKVEENRKKIRKANGITDEKIN